MNAFFRSVLQHDLSVAYFKVLKCSKESTFDLRDGASSCTFVIYDL
jgi:hypothetical protein